MALEPTDERRSAVDGATFHTLHPRRRPCWAELTEPKAIQKEVMGHRKIASTQRYNHLRR
jgi:hypothetical protein